MNFSFLSDHKQEDVKRVLRLLAEGGVAAEDVALVAAAMAYAGKKMRSGELFSGVWGKEGSKVVLCVSVFFFSPSPGLSLDKIRKFAQAAIAGVDNIYTQVC